MMPQTTALSVPFTNAHRCWERSPRTNRPCNRATGHSGRHHFAWVHLNGTVREVWGNCQICGKATTDGAACRKCGS